MADEPSRRVQAVHRLYSSVGRRFRRRRMARFIELMQPSASATIIDVGGLATTWEGSPNTLSVTVVNTDTRHAEGTVDNVRFLEGDARELHFTDDSFDIAFSNSVIEHVGSLEDQARMAREFGRVAPAYFLQTPARSFPIEPHYLTPFVHWLPRSMRRRILRNFTVWGLITRPSQEFVERSVDETRLLTRAELARLFPGATILPERVLGVTKSWVVVRTSRTG